MSDEAWMKKAITLAKHAESVGEVPVGAILTYQGELIAQGYNQPICTNDPTAHAEIIALREGALAQENYRLPGTTLYVTLEPCPMCIGAMVHARVERVVFGASDPRTGAVSSVFQLADNKALNHKIAWKGGVLAEECSELLKLFFKRRRLAPN